MDWCVLVSVIINKHLKNFDQKLFQKVLCYQMLKINLKIFKLTQYNVTLYNTTTSSTMQVCLLNYFIEIYYKICSNFKRNCIYDNDIKILCAYVMFHNIRHLLVS